MECDETQVTATWRNIPAGNAFQLVLWSNITEGLTEYQNDATISIDGVPQPDLHALVASSKASGTGSGDGDPTEPPVDPTEPPIDPTEPPVETTEPPVEPSAPPVVPATPPTSNDEPVNEPTQPAAPSGEPTPVAVVTSETPQLAATGSDSSAPVAIGMLALALGGTIVLAARAQRVRTKG